MIRLNEEEEAQKKLEFCTWAEKYGPQLRAKFKCWRPDYFPICGLTDKYFIIYRRRGPLENPKLLLVFVDRMQDGSVGDDWVIAHYFQYYNWYYALEHEVPAEVLNEIGDKEMQVASRYKTDSFDLQGPTDPFAKFPTVADRLAKLK
jgi:hypothetical protein